MLVAILWLQPAGFRIRVGHLIPLAKERLAVDLQTATTRLEPPDLYYQSPKANPD